MPCDTPSGVAAAKIKDGSWARVWRKDENSGAELLIRSAPKTISAAQPTDIKNRWFNRMYAFNYSPQKTGFIIAACPRNLNPSPRRRAEVAGARSVEHTTELPS